MTDAVTAHYGSGGDLAEKIRQGLAGAGKNPDRLTTRDLAPVDEFHFRGRRATLELAASMNLNRDSRVLDIGSGLGGPARTLAEVYGCRVTGIDLTSAFCEVAGIVSSWVGLSELTEFVSGDATSPPFADGQFDAAMTFHVAMNIAAKDKLYAQARRVLKQGGIFAIFDILQGEGGEAVYPAPWARDSSISHLATPREMQKLLGDAGFKILDQRDSTRESLEWLEARSAAKANPGPLPVTVQLLFGNDDYVEMIANQARGLRERRILTVSYICEA